MPFYARALVIEDQREATAILRQKGYLCDRLTHQEILSRHGTTSLGDLLAGSYRLLWISTPMDWYIKTPGKRAAPHWDRMRNLLQKGKALNMHMIMFGPPGYMWYMGPIRDTIQELKLCVIRVRL